MKITQQGPRLQFPCESCDKKYDSKQYLRVHQRTHTGEKPFVCEQCGKAFSDNGTCRYHIKYTHENYSQTCKLCQKILKTKRGFLEHTDSHNVRLYGSKPKYRIRPKNLHKCPSCHKEFSDKANLNRHLIAHENKLNNKPKNRTNGDKHRYDNSFRKEVAEFAIKYSNKKAMEQYNLSQTMVRRSIKLLQKPEMCAVCGKEFGWQSGLVRHMRNVHDDDSVQDLDLCTSNINTLENASNDIDEEKNRGKIEAEKMVSNLDIEDKKHIDILEMYDNNKEHYSKTVLVEIDNANKKLNLSNKNTINYAVNDIDQQNRKEETSAENMVNSHDIVKLKQNGVLHIFDKSKEHGLNSLGCLNNETMTKKEMLKKTIESLFEVRGGDISVNQLVKEIETVCDKVKKENVTNKDCPLRDEKESNTISCEYQENDIFTNYIDRQGQNLRENLPSENILPEQQKESNLSNNGTEENKIDQIVLANESLNENILDKGISQHEIKMKEQIKLGEETQYVRSNVEQEIFTNKNTFIKGERECIEILYGNPDDEVEDKKTDKDSKSQPGANEHKESEQVKKDVEESKVNLKDDLNDSSPESMSDNRLLQHKIELDKECENIKMLNSGLFKCSKCDTEFKKKQNARTHMKVVHLKIKKVICEKCPKLFSSHSELKRHMLSHTQEKNIRCKFCELKFGRKWNLSKHILSFHSERNLCCKFCDKMFPNEAMLQLHRKSHNKAQTQNFLCKICSKTFKQKSGLQGHMETHNEKKEFSCTECAEMFLTTRKLKEHINSVHKKIEHDAKFPCEYCGKIFFKKKSIRNHKLTHTDVSESVCSFCGTTFSGLRLLRYHMKMTHSDKSIPCEKCDKKFTTNSQLARHAKYHTKQKDFVCEICRKRFYEKRSLDEHVATLHGNDPKRFACEFCQRTFTRKHNVKSHHGVCKKSKKIEK